MYKTVFVNGTFDILHRGHLELLNYAKSLGEYVVVGIDDTKTVVDLYLKKAKILPKEINLVYEDNLMLTDVANMINELSDYTVPVNIVKNGMQNAYCGSGYLLNTMGIGLKGLKHQLRSTYEHLI